MEPGAVRKEGHAPNHHVALQPHSVTGHRVGRVVNTYSLYHGHALMYGSSMHFSLLHKAYK